MATNTTNYNLVKPSGKEKVDISVINTNMDAIDAALKNLDNSKTAIANNLTTTKEGSALDAVQGKVLVDSITMLNSSLNEAKQISTNSKYKSNLDFHDIYKNVELKREDGSLVMTSVLSGGTAPLYTMRAETYYDTDGITVTKTITYARTYDVSGNLMKEVISANPSELVGIDSDFGINGMIEEYLISVDSKDISIGDFVEFAKDLVANSPTVFEKAQIANTSVTALSDTKAIVTYMDVGNSNYGTAVVLTVSGTTITVGTPLVYQSTATTITKIKKLSETKAVVAYTDVSPYYGKAVVLTITGTTITVGTPVVFNSAATNNNSIEVISDTKAIVAYGDTTSANGKAVILTINGTTITVGISIIFQSIETTNISMTKLLDTKFLVAYTGEGGYGKAIVLTVTETTITAGIQIFFESVQTKDESIIALSDTQAIVVYRCIGNSNYGTARVLTVSGTTITAGAPVVFNSKATNNTVVTKISDTKVIVVYQDASPYYGTAIILTLNGTSLTVGIPVVFENASTGSIFIATLSETKAIVVYNDGGNAGYGTAEILIAYPNSAIQVATTSSNLIGIAKTSGKNDNVIKIYTI